MHTTNLEGPPDGFVRIGGDVDGWYSPDSGAVVVGLLLGREWHASNGSHYYRIKLGRPCPATGTPGAAHVLAAGMVIGVGERAALAKLRDYAGSGACEVWVKPGEKVKTKAGREAWRFELAIRGERCRSADDEGDEAAARAPSDGARPADAVGDGIPF